MEKMVNFLSQKPVDLKGIGRKGNHCKKKYYKISMELQQRIRKGEKLYDTYRITQD